MAQIMAWRIGQPMRGLSKWLARTRTDVGKHFGMNGKGIPEPPPAECHQCNASDIPARCETATPERSAPRLIEGESCSSASAPATRSMRRPARRMANAQNLE